MAGLLLVSAIGCATGSPNPQVGAGPSLPSHDSQERTRPTTPHTHAQLAPNDAGPWQRADVVWYGAAMHGRITASGRRFNAWGLTAAHRTLPFGTRIELRWEGRRVIVTITDRGPIRRDRTFDLSAGAFQRLAPLSRGVLRGVAWRSVG